MENSMDDSGIPKDDTLDFDVFVSTNDFGSVFATNGLGGDLNFDSFVSTVLSFEEAANLAAEITVINAASDGVFAFNNPTNGYDFDSFDMF